MQECDIARLALEVQNLDSELAKERRESPASSLDRLQVGMHAVCRGLRAITDVRGQVLQSIQGQMTTIFQTLAQRSQPTAQTDSRQGYGQPSVLEALANSIPGDAGSNQTSQWTCGTKQIVEGREADDHDCNCEL